MAVSVGVLTAKLTMDTTEFSRGASKATSDAKGLGAAMSGMNFKAVGAEIAGVGAILGGVFGVAITGAVKAASDLNESMTKSAVVFGESAKSVQDWAKTAALSLGQSNQLALESAATFGNLFTTMGIGQPAAAAMSMSMVQLAADLASFNNASPEDMLVKLKAGLVGEIEPLRSVGVAMNAATVEAKAMELGLAKTKDQISESDKVMARYALIIEQTKNAQGDFARTSEGVANQSRILKAQLADLTTQIGNGLLPGAQDLLVVFNKVLAMLIALPPQFKATAAAVLVVGAAVSSTMIVIGGLVALLGGPLTAAILAITAIMATLTAAIVFEWDSISKIFKGGTKNINLSFEAIAGFLGDAVDFFHIWAQKTIIAFDIVVTGAKSMVKAISAAFEGLRAGLVPILTGLVTQNLGMTLAGFNAFSEQVGAATKDITFSVGEMTGRITGNLAEINMSMGGRFRDAFKKAAGDVGTAIGQIETDMEKLLKGLKNTTKAAGEHGKAHSEAASKIAAAWAKVAEAAAKMDLESRKAMEETMLAEKAFAKDHYDIMLLRAETTEMFLDADGKEWKKYVELVEDAEHAYAQAVIEGIKERGRAIKEEEKIWKEIVNLSNNAFDQLLGGWADFANQALEVMHGLNKSIPSSLGGLLQKITELFTNSEQAAQKWASRITAVVGGVSTFLSTRHQGLGTGILGGAMAGAQIGGMFGGVGAAVGAGIGAIAGIFGSGKSKEQKEAEERQKKQIAMDMEKAAIDIQGAAMDVIKKALDAFKALADHVDVPKAAIKSFFATLEKVTKLFLQLAAKFAKDNLDAAKAFAEAMGPVVELMGGALQAFEAIRFYTAIPEKAIKDMANDLGRAAEAMGEVAIAVEDHIEKKAKRFADRVMPVVELIASAFEAFKSLAEYKGVASEAFTAFFIDLEIATNLMGELADNLSRNFLNKAKTYAERISVVVQAIGASVASLTSLRTYEAVPQAAFAALEHDILAALGMIDRLVAAAELYLDRAITFEDLVRRIVGALDSGVSMIRSVGGSLSPGSSLDTVRMAPTRTSGGAPASRGGSGVIIEQLSYTETSPTAQRLMDSLQALLGQAGLPLVSKTI